MTLEDENQNGSLLKTGGFTLVDFNIPQRDKPMVHTVQEAPLCNQCQRLDLTFFDPHCSGCYKILMDPSTTIAQIYAVIRQWVPQTQQNIEMLGQEILKRGAHVDDRDGLTDMTLLMYACKAGAMGVGDVTAAVSFSALLINKGADVSIRCRWTNMHALHYAVYFDVAPLVRLLLKASKCADIDSLCGEFDNGTPLHIAATSCSYEAAKCLLQHGANINIRDDLNQTPLDCIPDPDMVRLNTEMANNAAKLKRMFMSEADFQIPKYGLLHYDRVSGKVVLSSLGLSLGDRVMVGGAKMGTLRFCGTTEFATGQWAGIELDEPEGKNDGSVGGIAYFSCPAKHGIFAPISKICKPGTSPRMGTPKRELMGFARHSKVNVSHVTAKVDTGLRRSPSMHSVTSDPGDIEVDDQVIVAGQRTGIVRFSGKTRFAPGWWYGIELDKPVGKNDGSVSGERYFTCEPKKGVFAPPSRVKKYGDSFAGSSESLNSLDGIRTTGRASVGFLNLSATKKTPPRSKSVTGMHRSPKTPLSMSGEFRLQEGMSVYLNNELGLVRYIGPAHFADGLWLGVELRTAKGKNDGSVQGKRYFSCKPNHGLLVRPSRVTVRGIKGDKLVSEQHQQMHSTPKTTASTSMQTGM
ncbi:CAP-Gly domain-containing linker protein 4-like isoform X2 [Ptychodera flava]|uniref:CAP-Gly domain-containing linker protein 4-like isoform X2 n=1 Tax=Ptychodera flava TaxID=63121 RepID=UPI00396A6695